MAGDVIKNLLDYTVEHQKITLALGTALATALGYHATQTPRPFPPKAVGFLVGALILLAVSAIAGGVVAANLAIMEGPKVPPPGFQRVAELENFPIGLFPSFALMPLGSWRNAEHWTLWVALGVAMIGALLVLQGRNAEPKKPPLAKDQAADTK
jgi:hypothetical protein